MFGGNSDARNEKAGRKHRCEWFHLTLPRICALSVSPASDGILHPRPRMRPCCKTSRRVLLSIELLPRMGTASSGWAADGKNFPRLREGKLLKAPGALVGSADSHRRSNYSVSLLQLVALLVSSKHSAAEDVKHIRFNLLAEIEGIGVIGSTQFRTGARPGANFELGLQFNLWVGSGAQDRTKQTRLSKSATPVRPKSPVPRAWPSQS